MKKVAWGVVVVGVAAVPLAWLGRGTATTKAEKTGEATVFQVSRRDIGTVVKATGVIKPMVGAEVKVGSRASGVVARLHVRIGDAVRKGDLLAELDDRELVTRRDQAAAVSESARAQADYAASDLARKRELAAARLISAGDLDLAERAHAVARQQLAEAAANLAYARTQLTFARITAPIKGVVGSVSTQEGETVSASLAAPTFVTLIDLDRLEVWAYVDETDVGRIRLGQKARFTVDTYADDAFEGTVTAVYPEPEIRDNVVNYVTVVAFEPPRGRTLRPEMTTTVTIAIDRRENVLAVPRAAVHREEGRAVVYLRQGDAVVSRPITTGVRDDGYWEVVDGLRGGEAVVVGRVDSAGTGQQQ
jgi:macrolide-specific efflux system membrane fusion protein